ncbi:MAG: ABC transporter permease [Acidobacteriota bacterium]
MHGILQDVRYCLRMSIKFPGFTAVAVLSIALGIGASTAVFSLVNAMLFKPLPVEQAEQLAALYVTEPQSSFPDAFSYPDYLDYLDKNEVFSDLVGHFGTTLSMANLSGNGSTQPELMWGELVTGNYFTGLGVKPVIGRTLTREDDLYPGAHPVAVLSYNFWQRRFAANPEIIGKTLKLNGHDFTVIGVAAYGFSGTRFLGFIPDIWLPLMMHEQVLHEGNGRRTERGSRWLNVNGRMKPGITIKQATSAMNLIAQQLGQSYPQTNRDVTIKIQPGDHKTQPLPGGDNILTLISAMMMGVMSLVLLIVCVNVANLLLARATVRRREIAIRLALGASRSRLVRQLLTESMVLSMIGGSVGMLFAIWLIDLFKTSGPPLDFETVNPDYDLALDYRVLGFTLIVSLATGVIFGLLPALQASKPDLVAMLKGEAQMIMGRFWRFNLRNALVVVQVALSLVLLICAGLFLQSLHNAQQMNPGFETKNILLASVQLNIQGYNQARGRAFYKEIIERAERLPGVESASLASHLPLDDGFDGDRIFVEGYVPRSENEKIVVFYSIIGKNYFQTMKTPIVAGRAFDQRDKVDSSRVVIINETMARRYWPGQDPIGKRLQMGNTNSPYLEIVGVAKDGKYITIGETPIPFMFLPLEQNYTDGRSRILLRTQADPTSVVASLRREVQELDETLPLFGIKTIQQFMQRSLWGVDAATSLISSLALFALLLAAIGIYGVISYTVAQRTQEIGIRIALGARQRDVLKLVIKQGLALTLGGVSIGLVSAFVLTRLMADLLFDVSATEPTIFALLALLLTSVAMLACYIPARKAMKVDPMVTLRYE